MKQVTNLTKNLRAYDLDSFDENGRRRAVHLAPGESVSLKNDDAASRQLVAALDRKEISIEDAKAAKEDKEDKKEESGESKKPAKKSSSKPKDKEDK